MKTGTGLESVFTWAKKPRQLLKRYFFYRSAMQVSKRGNELKVEPATPELQGALQAILSMGGLDELVTYALRQHGYGNDDWCVTYAKDQDEYEKNEDCIPEGYIEICCVGCGDETGPVLPEMTYLQLLAKICAAYGLEERSQTLQDFIENPKRAYNLIETDSKRCNERWKTFVPFLERNGWKNVGGNLEHTLSRSHYSIDAFTGDLGVLYRQTKRNLDPHSDARQEWLEYQQSLLKSLEEYFEYERKLHL